MSNHLLNSTCQLLYFAAFSIGAKSAGDRINSQHVFDPFQVRSIAQPEPIETNHQTNKPPIQTRKPQIHTKKITSPNQSAPLRGNLTCCNRGPVAMAPRRFLLALGSLVARADPAEPLGAVRKPRAVGDQEAKGRPWEA